MALRRPRRGVVAFALICLAALTGSAEQTPSTTQDAQRPVFRAEVNSVILDIRVVDRDGRFVRDLTRDDFRVYEEDRPQDVTSFALVDLPVTAPGELPPIPAVRPDVASNLQPLEGRLYVMVLDDLEGEEEWSAASQAQRSANVRSIARDFVENHLAPGDRLALMTTSGRRDMTVQFTDDRRRLLEAVDRFHGGYGQKFYINVGGVLRPDNIHLVMQSLKGLGDWLSDVSLAGHRKGVVLIGERLGRSMKEGIDPLADRENIDLQAFLQAAARSNTALYAIDAVGVPSGKDGTLKPVFIDDGMALDLDRIATLVSVADATGGFAAHNTNDYRPAFTRVVEENSSYYLLSYTSTNSRQDGRFRKTRVEVTRPGLEVRTRSGYWAERPETRNAGRGGLPRDLEELLRSPVPISGLTMNVTTAPFLRRGSNATLEVIVEARPSVAALAAMLNGRFNGAMEIAVVAADRDGKTRSHRGTLTMNLSTNSRDVVETYGVRLLSAIELPPGDHHVSVAASDGMTRGSVRYDVTVPDFDEPIEMSGLVIASGEMARVPTKGDASRWLPFQGMMPTANRAFRPGDDLVVFAEVYDNDRDAHETSVGATVYAEDGSIVYEREQALELKRDETRYPVVVPIRLAGAPPGAYVLTMDVRSSRRPASLVKREVPFVIREQ